MKAIPIILSKAFSTITCAVLLMLKLVKNILALFHM